MKLRM